jgi:glutathione peroxidase
MKKILWLTLLGVLACNTQKNNTQNTEKLDYTQPMPAYPVAEEVIETNKQMKNFYDFTVETLDGNTFSFSSLKGKKVMVVNTASECGLTPQYKNLQALYEKYQNKDFVIVGFPANNFGAQEPGSNEQIGSFCQKNYGVTFPMMAKISVKGSDMHELYQFLTQKPRNGVEDSEVKWNFQKYLISENGKLVKVIPPTTMPDDVSIINWIEGK